jgi:endonuclease/exonuclease/phosphatase family metal-dependent hydrolase
MAEFSLLSLNTFGLPFFLGWERLRRITRELDRSSYDVVCLQEIQQNGYMTTLQHGLPSFPNQVSEKHIYAPKGGLAVFSRLPVAEHRFEVYQDRGIWISISISDWALYKGILSVGFDVEGLKIVVLLSHMHANYAGQWQLANPMAKTQLSQVQQLNRAIHAISEDTLVITCGDLNFPKNSFLYEELIGEDYLFDPLANDPRPTYRPFPLVPSRWKISLDHMLIRRPALTEFQIQADVIEVEDAQKYLPIQRFLTDHNALTCKIQWDSSKTQQV